MRAIYARITKQDRVFIPCSYGCDGDGLALNPFGEESLQLIMRDTGPISAFMYLDKKGAKELVDKLQEFIDSTVVHQ